jgi:hypothetical protein
LTVLVWAAALFALAQVGAGLCADYLYPQVRFAFLYRQLARLRTLPHPPAVVFLGSSRIGTCLREDVLTDRLRSELGEDSLRVFNAGMPVGDLIVSEHVFARLIRLASRPRLLVVEVSPESLNRHNGWLPHHAERQLAWGDLSAYAEDLARAGCLGEFLTERLVPLYAHRKGFWNLPGELCSPRRYSLAGAALWERALGGVSGLTVAEKRARSEAGLADARHCLRDYAPGGNAAAALERLLERCRALGIEVLLVAVPVAGAHRDLYEPAIESSYQSYVKEMRQRFGCDFRDCRTQIPDDHFLDNHHADDEGAERFSAWFASEVLTPRWKSLSR